MLDSQVALLIIGAVWLVVVVGALMFWAYNLGQFDYALKKNAKWLKDFKDDANA
jgi:nitrogen fixation-related uncharacterized protein